MDEDPQIQDAELVTDENLVNTPEDGGSVLINMESMIKSHISQIDKLREELQKHSSMLKDIIESDETYKKHAEAAKETSRIKTATKKEILKRPQAADLNEKVKSFKSQLHELEDGLSDYLREYQRMSGVNEIEGDDGQVREIIFVPKLIKKTSIYQ